MTVYVHSDHGQYPVKRLLSNNPRKFRILRLFLIRVNGYITIVMPGFVLDFFSVPRPAWWFQPPATGPGVVGALDHDGKYAINWHKGRKQADVDFRSVMRRYGETRFRANVMYRVVRTASWRAWQRKTDDQIEHNSHFVFVVPESEAGILKLLIRRGKLMEGVLEAEYKYDDAMERNLKSISMGDIDNHLKGQDDG